MGGDECWLEAGRRYEAWYGTGFGRRADALERRLLREHLLDMRGAKSLLEVGSGTGHFADLWADAGLDAVGVDLDQGRLRFSLRREPGFPVVRGDALALPFRDGGFDVVAMVASLEFIDPPVGALEEAARVARLGLLIGALNAWSPVGWWRRGRRASSYGGAGFFSPLGLRRLVRRLDRRKAVVRRHTGLYPVPWLDRVTVLPFGAFIVMSVRFEEEEA